MKHTTPSSQTTSPDRVHRGFSAVAGVLLASMISGVSLAATIPAPKQTTETVAAAADNDAQDAALAAESQAKRLAEQWGVEVTSIRMTASDHMIDYRYRVLDAAKATDLFKRQIKPNLIHQESGRVLAVPSTAKLGPLRNSNTPQDGKIYWMFFGNAGNLVKAGDKVTVVIGEFRVENLVVE